MKKTDATPAKRKGPSALKLDQLDLQLVDALQHDARLSIRELGRRLGVSAPTVSDRLSRLEAAGVIRSYGAVVSLGALGYGVVAFVGVFDTGEKFGALDKWAQEHPNVLECHLVSGDFDYLIKARISEMASYRKLLGNTLLTMPHVRDSKSYIVMEEVKETLNLPV